MNYNVSQILNFENCNAGIPFYLIRDASIEIICDNWQSNIDLAESFIAGTVDIAAESASINESLSEAGCETRVDEYVVKKALAYWVEVETLSGNL